jgi:hypothetical protein
VEKENTGVLKHGPEEQREKAVMWNTPGSVTVYSRNPIDSRNNTEASGVDSFYARIHETTRGKCQRQEQYTENGLEDLYCWAQKGNKRLASLVTPISMKHFLSNQQHVCPGCV